jgi:hypothetical protein
MKKDLKLSLSSALAALTFSALQTVHCTESLSADWDGRREENQPKMQPRQEEIQTLEERLSALWVQEEQEEPSSALPSRFGGAFGGSASIPSLNSKLSGHSKRYRVDEIEPARAIQPRSSSTEVEDGADQEQKRKKQRTTKAQEARKRGIPGNMAVRGLVINPHVMYGQEKEKSRDIFERGPAAPLAA